MDGGVAVEFAPSRSQRGGEHEHGHEGILFVVVVALAVLSPIREGGEHHVRARLPLAVGQAGLEVVEQGSGVGGVHVGAARSRTRTGSPGPWS